MKRYYDNQQKTFLWWRQDGQCGMCGTDMNKGEVFDPRVLNIIISLTIKIMEQQVLIMVLCYVRLVITLHTIMQSLEKV